MPTAATLVKNAALMPVLPAKASRLPDSSRSEPPPDTPPPAPSTSELMVVDPVRTAPAASRTLLVEVSPSVIDAANSEG